MASRILRGWCIVWWCEDGAGEGQPGPVWWEDVAVPSRLPAPGLLGTTAAKPHQKMQIVWWYDARCPSPAQVQVCHSSVVCHQSGGDHPVSQVWDHTLLHTSSVSVNIDWVKKKSSIKVFLRLTEVLSGGGVLVARVRRVAKTLPGQILSLPGSFWQQTSV